MSNNALVTLISRILLSILFIPAGFGKLTALGATGGYFAAKGLPLPEVTAVIVGLVELFGGLAVLVGFQTRYAAILLGLFTIAAAFVGHLVPWDQANQINFFKNLAIAGGFFVLAQYGAGALSVDAKRG
ncbi:putative oxidoreductase [Phyllobacterium trifolii]|jgi:putative oxidoreductase|uniref:Putative oxidoreductase n=1 Tax=Phyllobacterium trifolii TaxID=300193 RepID=A0A839U2G7_9HYPH|nr:DoxX family protein [Phyllobacterium trifolii]MBB3144637.1 putative oxidoreductase [Phyllobacterium trifolii]